MKHQTVLGFLKYLQWGMVGVGWVVTSNGPRRILQTLLAKAGLSAAVILPFVRGTENTKA